jgi:hypothetical protein
MYEDAIGKKKARVEEINRALDQLPPSSLIEIKGQLARVSSRSVRELIEERIHLEQAIAELKAEDEAGRRSDSTIESIRSNARMFNTKMRGESLDGLRLFEQIMQDAGIKIEELRDLFDRHASHLVLGKNGEEIDIVLSREFFSDLPGTPAFKKAATSYSNVLSKRMMARLTRVFHCKSGVPVEIVLDWPIEAAPHRDASYIHVQIRDLRQVDCLAGCSVLTTHQQSVFDIHKDPFLWQELTINSVRAAIDRQQIKFFSRRELPSTLKEVLLDIPPRGQSENLSRDIESYIASKVFWLGFKRAGKSAAVWIGDPWDASYLQTSPMELLQRAQILESKDYIALDGTNEFATASKQLLLKTTDYETGELTGMAEGITGSS